MRHEIIEIEKRRALAQALRRLLSGTINNVEFDSLDLEFSQDPAVRVIWETVWSSYDDFAEHKLRLTQGQVDDLKRCIVFLYTDYDYEWFEPQGLFDRLAVILRQVLNRLKRRPLSMLNSDLNYLVWPFARTSDYEVALQNPKLLSGS